MRERVVDDGGAPAAPDEEERPFAQIRAGGHRALEPRRVGARGGLGVVEGVPDALAINESNLVELPRGRSIEVATIGIHGASVAPREEHAFARARQFADGDRGVDALGSREGTLARASTEE